ncbi:MAG: hypothetical protein HY287_05585 [Planctomycetes bacterium]|nr:hypothetical protein [Planctomycetota bacterium]MBI3833783.1 hypothetical protein [Planctomycetota bacterium]
MGLKKNTHRISPQPLHFRVGENDCRLLAWLFIASLFAAASASGQVFLDSNAGKDFKQCANADPNVSDPLHWINSILQQNNSIYVEGMSVPQRIILTDIPGAPSDMHTLTMSHQSTKHSAGVHAYDFLTSWQQAYDAANAITDGAGLLTNLLTTEACEDEFSPSANAALCNSLRASFSMTASVPDAMPDPGIGGGVASKIAAYETLFGNRVIKIYGNAAITAASIAFGSPFYTGTDDDANYVISWTSSSTNILIEVAGHVSVGLDPLGAGIGYGAGLGASSISGGPYHFHLFKLDGASLGSQDNQIKGADVQADPCNPNPCDDGIACTVDTCTRDFSVIPATYTCSHVPNDSLCPSDNNPCTDDACVVGVGCLHTSNDSNSCSDGLYCNGMEFCQGGACHAGTPPCDDHKTCTTDGCNEATDTCTYTSNNAACDDGLFCNGVETCNPTKGNATTGCKAGTPVDCSGLTNQCNVGICNESLDSCQAQPVANGTSCNDGLFCTVGDSCQSGVCTGTPRDCSDGIGCTNDSCDETIDACVHAPNNSKCDDGLFCNGREICDPAHGNPTTGCVPGSAPCTAPCACDEVHDLCDCACPTQPCPPALECYVVQCVNPGPSGQCVYSPAGAGTACSSDGINCTTDACDGSGNCVHTPNDSQCPADGNPCTDTICHPTAGCINVNDDSNACDDGLYCTVNDHCASGTCVGGPRNCSDGVDCTTDQCDETGDTCLHFPSNSDCPGDGNPCTDELCDLLLGCQSVPNDANDCSNGLFCTLGHCAGGQCVTQPRDCHEVPDINCTIDTCDEVNNACVHTPQNGICGDGLGCNGQEVCNALTGCQPGTPVICLDDGNACTIDICKDPKGVCQHNCESPGINCPGDRVCECDDAACRNIVATPVDPCSHTPNVQCRDVITPGKFPQDYQIDRTCTVTNDCGNQASCSFIIKVVDTTPPSITCPPDKDCECGLPCDFGVPTVTDNCDPSPIVTVEVHEIPGDCLATPVVAGITPPPKLTVTRTYSASDGSGTLAVATGQPNISQCTQTIKYYDRTPPLITACPADFKICGGRTFHFTPPTSTDLCGGSTVHCTRSDGLTLSDPTGTTDFTITCTATDDCGNTSACETHVDVIQTPECINVPTLSQWGACVLTLLLLCAAKVSFSRRQKAA